MNDRTSQARDQATSDSSGDGTRDGIGAGDHDEPFVGWRSYHFSTQQMARLLILRGEVQDSRLSLGRFAADLPTHA